MFNFSACFSYNNGGNFKTWDANASKDCKDKTLPADAAKSSYISGCETQGCTKNVKIAEGKVVGVGDNASDQYQSYIQSGNEESCNLEILNYLENDNPQPAELTFDNCKDENGGLVNIYICNDAQILNKESYEACKIDDQVKKCNIDMEKIRSEKTGGPHIVGKGAGENGTDLNGLPPCGKEVWVYDKVIYYEKLAEQG